MFSSFKLPQTHRGRGRSRFRPLTGKSAVLNPLEHLHREVVLLFLEPDLKREFECAISVSTSPQVCQVLGVQAAVGAADLHPLKPLEYRFESTSSKFITRLPAGLVSRWTGPAPPESASPRAWLSALPRAPPARWDSNRRGRGSCRNRCSVPVQSTPGRRSSRPLEKGVRQTHHTRVEAERFKRRQAHGFHQSTGGEDRVLAAQVTALQGFAVGDQQAATCHKCKKAPPEGQHLGAGQKIPELQVAVLGEALAHLLER